MSPLSNAASGFPKPFRASIEIEISLSPKRTADYTAAIRKRLQYGNNR
jgi:hypothetical protein